MSAREATASRCVSVEKVPTDLKGELKYKISERLQLSESKILVEEVTGFHIERGFSRFVFLLEDNQNVDRLCNEIKEEIIENLEGESFQLTYERSTECEIPDDWTRIEASAIPGGPTVPPRVPHTVLHEPGPPGMATFYQNAPGQQQGQGRGQYPGPIAGQYPGQPLASVPSSIPGQTPGPVPTGMRPGMPHQFLFMGQGHPGMQCRGPYPQGQGQPGMQGQSPYPQGQGQPGMQGQGPYPQGQGQPGMQGQGPYPQGQGQPGMQGQGHFPPQGQPRGPFRPMQFIPGYPPFMPYGALGPMPPGFPVPHKPGEEAQIPKSHGDGQSQPGQPSYPFMPVPWGPYDPLIFGGMYPQGQSHDPEQQPHSGPPPPYNGSIPDQMDQARHDSKTAEKHVAEDPKPSELKEPIEGPGSKDHGGVPKWMGDQEEYMEKLNRKIREEQSGRDTATADVSSLTHDELRQELIKHGENIGPVTVSTREFYENRLRTLRESIRGQSPQSFGGESGDEHDGTEKSQEESSSFEILGTEDHTEAPQCTIQISCIPKSVSTEFLQIYFESAKRSGGGVVIDVEHSEGDEMAFLTYEKEEVARNVVERQHTLNGAQLEVCLYTPVPPMSPSRQNSEQERGPSRQQSMNEDQLTKIVVKNLPPSASEQYLEMYFENTKRQGGGPVKAVEFYADDHVAIVEFESADAVDTVLGKLPVTMDGHNLEVEVYSPVQEEPVPLCTVEVRGPSDVIASEMLEMYFESERRSGGGEVTVVEKEGTVAYLTFVSEEVAQRVVERGQHKVNNKKIEVSLQQPNQRRPKTQSSTDAEPPSESLCIVRVDGISNVKSMETLQYYFENAKRSGGGEMEDSGFEVYEEDDAVYITYKEEEAARRVAERGQHTVEGQTVHVTLYDPVRQTVRADSQQDEEEEPLCSIKVTGISKIGSKDTMEYYFENAKRSGGGSIKSLEVHKEEDYAYVTFGGENVARRVANKAHRLEEVDLHVSLYRPPKPRPAYTDRLIIKGVSPTTTKDCLFNFLEAKSGASPNQLVYGEQEGTIMVTFDSDPDFDKLVKVCEKRPLEGSSLTVSKACVSNCIIISNLKTSTSCDIVQFYFENMKRSNGGDIEKVKMLEETGTCLVFFQNYAVVDDVLKKKHKLEGQELTVQVYIEELGRSQGDGTEPRVKIPDNITIDNVEEKIVDFLKKHESCREAVNKQLEGCYAKVVWPEKGPNIVIECEITVKTPDFRKLVRDWKNNVEKNFIDYVNQLSCKEHPVWDEGWDAVLEGLGEINIDNPDAVALFVDKKDKKIRVVGYKHTVDSVSKMVDKVIKDVSDEIERRKQTVRQTISNLKPLQLRMLLASKYPNKMEDKFPNLKVKINQNKNELILEGIQPDIQAAKVNMYEQTSQLGMRVLENIPQNCIDLFHSKPVKDYIVKKLKSQRLVGVWEAVDLKLAVCSYETDLSNCVKFISESVQERTLQVHKESSTVLTSQQWVDRIAEIHTKNAGLCKICCKEDFSKVYVTATDDLIDELQGIVAKFLKLHTILGETFSVGNKSIVRLIQSHHMDKLTEISKDLATHYVQIHCDSKGISVQGTEEGINLAKERLSAFAGQLEKKQHTIKRPGLASHMADKGQENVKSVEGAYPVVIKVGDEREEDTDFRTVTSGKFNQGPDVGVKVYAVGEAYDDRKVYTAEGDMSQVRVDILVNSADSSISLSGGLGKMLATKGGNEISKECKDYVKRYGKLDIGDVFMSTGGKLPAQYIVHASCPHWENGKRKEDEILKDVVFKAMQQATVKSVKSIAIPALGCGNYGFPLKVATEIIANAIKDFFREVQESTIMEVFFIDVIPVTVEAFTGAIKNVFDNVQTISQAHGNNDDDIDDDRGSYRPVPQPRRSIAQSGDSSSDESGPDSSTGFGSINVEVIKGEIATLKVDVIVNTTGKNLDLRNGAVSASLLRAGGDAVQQDLTQNYPNGLGDGDIAISVGGKLHCWNVFHGSLINWDGGDKAIPALNKLMSSCLQEADKRQAKSIAFPAIGTGQLGFPRDTVAKEMFSAIGKFENKNPSSSVKEVKLVVYHKDYGTVKAFDFEKKNWSGGSRKSKRASRDVEPIYTRKKHDTGEEGWVNVPSSKPDGSLDIGGISINVKQGDITESKDDCIINSSNEDLDLSRGAVAKALLKKGGEKLRKEAASRSSEMKRNQVAMTSAPGLPCQHIIHVVAQDNEADWKQVVEKCLQMANDKKIQSIAFPALGTGLSMKAKDSARMILKSIQSFSSQTPRYLRQINFIIYQADMVTGFKQAVSSFITEKPGSALGDAWKYVKGTFKGAFGGKPSGPGGDSLERRTYKHVNPNEVNFVFYSLSIRDINDAIKRLEKLIDSDLLDKVLKDSYIAHLSPDQIRELKSMADGKAVQLDIQPDQSYLKIAGMSKNVLEFTDKVQVFLRDVERGELQKNHAEMLKNVVQWYYIEITDVGRKLEAYSVHLNYMIEQAFKNQKPNYQFQDKDGDNYIVDFKTMDEYPEKDPTDTCAVVRRDLIKESAAALPENWSVMNKTENLKVVTLQTTDQEYQNVAQQFSNTGGANFNIIRIDRIQNVTLFQQYQAKKNLLEQQNAKGTTNERILWHGTAPEAVDSINAHGFNRSYCGKNATAFGDGVYFAVQASYSCSNTYSRPDPTGVKRIYLSRVLTGEFLMGKQGMRVPPQKPSGAASHALYDSVVNNVQNPSMFIIFNDTQAYPDYLVTFKPK